MSFNSANKSSQEVIKSRTLYTGLHNFKIVAVNPGKQQAEALGINLKSEDYTGKDNEQNAQVRIDFWLKSDKLPLVKKSFFLTQVTPTAKTGKTLFINISGATHWSDSIETIESNPRMAWFMNDVREAYRGEPELTEFLKAYLNVDTRKEGVEARFTEEEILKMIAGDVSPIRNVIKAFPDNEVQLFCVVRMTKTGNFQDFYDGFFGRPSVKDKGAWIRALGDERIGTRADRYRDVDFGSGFDFAPWTGQAVNPEIFQRNIGGASGAPASDGGEAAWGSQPAAGAATEDVPF